MSDGDVYLDDDSEGEEIIVEEEEQAIEVEIDDSPESVYQQAKGSVGFQNDLALKLFLEVVQNEEADAHLRAKASYNALPLLASTEDLDSLISTFDFFYKNVKSGEINQKHFEKTMESVLVNIHHAEPIVRGFLKHASQVIDPNSPAHQNIALDVKLRLIEIEIKYANYKYVDELIPDTAAFIPECPDPSDVILTRYAGRLFIIQIELALMRNQEEEISELYKKIQKLQNVSWSPKQSAVLKFVEGRKAMETRNFQKARAEFAEAFRGFNDAGSNRRTEVISYWALATMLVHDQTDIFSSSEIFQFKTHPQVAPLSQLYECYLKSDIVGYKLKLGEAKKIFHSPLYDGFLGQVEHYVLKNSLASFCSNYTQIELSYLAQRVMGEEELASFNKMSAADQKKYLEQQISVVKNLLIELILSRKLDATIDLVNGVIVTHQSKESLFLGSITPMIDVMDTMSLQFLRRTKITAISNRLK